MLRAAVTLDGPVALRYPRGGEGREYPAWDGTSAVVLRAGGDITLVSYGILINELMDAADILAEQGIEAEVVKLHQIAPLEPEFVMKSVRKTGRLLVLEDCYETGGIGQQLAAALALGGIVPQTLILKNLKGSFAPQGTVKELRRALGLDASAVAEDVNRAVRD